MGIRRIFYAAAGPADLIEAHRAWKDEVHFDREVSITFSSQIQDFCQDIGAKLFMVSVHPDTERLVDQNLIIEHRPKRAAGGVAYHIEDLRYAVSLLRSARAFGADLALLDSGTSHYFAMALFPLFGIPVVPILHNSLWPHGFRPHDFLNRLVQWLDARFWRKAPLAGIAVSPECERQVDELAPGHGTPMFQVRAQFLPDYFATIPTPPPHDERPFQVMFIGRVDSIKGVLDIPAMARFIEDSHPGLVKWVICGRGPDFEELQRIVAEQRVGNVVDLRGWVSLEDLREVYANSHAAIVPTRSDFREGLAMTAAEAILAGRPLITNPVVPAHELLAPACILARTNDAESHARAVLELATDSALYERLRLSCPRVGAQFYDRGQGLTATLHRAVGHLAEAATKTILLKPAFENVALPRR